MITKNCTMTAARNRDPRTISAVDLGETSVILHSQANRDQFPDNVMSNFRSKQTKPLPLYGAWTIALQSMQYNRNIINLEAKDGDCDHDDIVRLKFTLHSTGVSIVYTHQLDLTIPRGISDTGDIAQLVNQGLESKDIQYPANMDLSIDIKVWEGWVWSADHCKIWGTLTTEMIFGKQRVRKGKRMVGRIMNLFNQIGPLGSAGLATAAAGYSADVKKLELVSRGQGPIFFLSAGQTSNKHRARLEIRGGTTQQRVSLQRVLGFRDASHYPFPFLDTFWNGHAEGGGMDWTGMRPGTLADTLLAAEDGPLNITLSKQGTMKGYERVVMEVDNTRAKGLSNPFRETGDLTFLASDAASVRLPVDLAGEALRNVNDHTNAVHLEFGWRRDARTIAVIYTRTAFLPVPGSYRNFKVFSTELYNLFSQLHYHEDHDTNLSDLVEMHQEPGSGKLSFHLRPRESGSTLPILNYVTIHFSPELAVMTGLLPPLSAEVVEVPYVRLLGHSSVSNDNDLDGPFPGLGAGVDTFTTKPIPADDETDHIYTCPHTENYDLGITEMYVYLPHVVDRMSVGQTSAPLLDSVPIDNNPSSPSSYSSNRVHHTVINPRKRRLLTETLDETEVEVKDARGKRIKFPTSINGVTFQCSLQKHS